MDSTSDLTSGVLAPFEELYQTYKRPIYRYCLRMIGDIDSAKDVVQQVFLSLHLHRDHIRKPEQVSAWLFTTARHACIACLEQREKSSPISERPSLRTPADVRNEQETARVIADAVARLQPDYREVIILREYQSLSYKEIADITQTNVSTVKFRLFSARRKLAEFLKPILGRGSRMRVR